MEFFLETKETIGKGHGFSHFDRLHLIWLAVFVLAVAVNCIWYRKLTEKGRERWKKTAALLIIADELFKMAMLFIGGRYTPDYLPLHLCSINVFTVAIHAWKPSKLLSNFLYTICIPGALAALLFPTWTKLPLANFMHIHSFTIHILLAVYPLVPALCGELKPEARWIPKCLGLLAALAVVALVFNLIFDTNFMFLMSASKGNPLYWFKQNWGNHLYGFPVLITAVIIVMYVPMELYRKYKAKRISAY